MQRSGRCCLRHGFTVQRRQTARIDLGQSSMRSTQSRTAEPLRAFSLRPS
jgi:hypothetical protein